MPVVLAHFCMDELRLAVKAPTGELLSKASSHLMQIERLVQIERKWV